MNVQMNYHLLIFIVWFGVCCSVVSGQTPVKACSTGLLPEVEFIALNKVCKTDPCPVYAGNNFTMKMSFKSPKYLDNIMPKVIAHYILEIDFPLGQDDACEGITNTPCPIVENELVNYEFTLLLFDNLPNIELPLTFYIQDKNTKENVVCLEVNIAVK